MITEEKNLSKRTGVYAIRNSASGKLYVGSAAKDFSCRLARHRLLLLRGHHYNKHLQSECDLHGLTSFEFVVLQECPPSECLGREQFWINFFHPEFNTCKIANSWKGLKHSEESKAKMRGRRPSTSATLKGHGFSPETLGKMSLAKRGRKLSEETKKKLSVALMGVKKSPEAIRNMGIARKKVWAEKRKSA